MVRHNEGLTKTYNRFHDPAHDGSGIDGLDPAQVVRDIDQLRRLHSELDRAVLAAYGWTDLDPTPVFLLDYEDEEDEDAPKRGKGRKKPWRLRFPDTVRDEILARLLALNARYAEEERREAELEQPRTFAAKPRPKATTPNGLSASKPSRRANVENPSQGRLL